MKRDKTIDAKLVTQYLSGNANALTELVKRWHKLFCEKAYWLVKDVDVAKNGEEAIEKIKETNYSIILMDIIMPKMDGLECAQRIRALKDIKKSKTPILAVTGNIRNYSLADFQSFGIDDYVEKPVNFDTLLPKINGMIDA